MSTIKAVIFDLDGTLLNTEALSCRAVIEAFARTNLIIPQDILDSLKADGNLLPWDLKRKILGLRGSEWVPIVLSYAQEHWNVDMEIDWQTSDEEKKESSDGDNEREAVVNSFWKNWEVRLNELCGEVEACPGALELVEGLKAAGVPMAIATSSRLDSVNKKRCK